MFSGFGDSQFKGQKSPANWDYHELMKGHDVMITAPEELTQLLMRWLRININRFGIIKGKEMKSVDGLTNRLMYHYR